MASFAPRTRPDDFVPAIVIVAIAARLLFKKRRRVVLVLLLRIESCATISSPLIEKRLSLPLSVIPAAGVRLRLRGKCHSGGLHDLFHDGNRLGRWSEVAGAVPLGNHQRRPIPL